MRVFKFIILAIIFLVIGYLLGNVFPYSSINLFQETIEGNIQVEVELLMSNNQPVPNLEVDLAAEPGPPPVGGIVVTNEQGLAVFNVLPGKYFIYFNYNNFPDNLAMPESQPLEVGEGKVNKATIILNTK